MKGVIFGVGNNTSSPTQPVHQRIGINYLYLANSITRDDNYLFVIVTARNRINGLGELLLF